MPSRLVHRFLVTPASRIAADVASAVTEGTTGPPTERAWHGRDWWTTTIAASAVSIGIGCAYVTTIWPAAALWFAIALLLPVRGVSEGLRTVPYFLLTGVLLSSVPAVGWWLCGAAVVAAAAAAAAAWARWRKRARLTRSDLRAPAS